MSNIRRHLPCGGSKPPPVPSSSSTTPVANSRNRFNSPIPSAATSSNSPRLFPGSQQLKCATSEEESAARMVNRASDLLATYSDYLKAVVAVCSTGNLLCHLLASGPLVEVLSLPQREMALDMRESWEELNMRVSDKVAAIHVHTLSSIQDWISFNKVVSVLSPANRDDLSKLLSVSLATFLQLQQQFAVLGGDGANPQAADLRSKNSGRSLARSSSLEESLPLRERKTEDTLGDLESAGSDCEGGLRHHLNMLMTRIGGRTVQNVLQPPGTQFYLGGHQKDDSEVPRRLSYSGPMCSGDADAPVSRRWSVPGLEIQSREPGGSQTTWYLGLSSLSIDTDSAVLPQTDLTLEGGLASVEDVDRVIRLLSSGSPSGVNSSGKEIQEPSGPWVSGGGGFDWVWQPADRRRPCGDPACNGHDATPTASWTSPYSRLYSWARTDSCSSSEEGACDAVATPELDAMATVVLELDSISANRRRHSSGGAASGSNATSTSSSTRTQSIGELGVDGSDQATWPLKQVMDNNSLYSSAGVSIWTPAPLDYLSVPGYGS